MSYADFTAKDLKEKFGVKFQGKRLFEDVPAVQPSEWLKTTLEKGLTFGYSTEKSRSERIVSPVLVELSDINAYDFYIHSGASLDTDADLGLKGECDFLFSFTGIRDFVTSPAFCITQAKNHDIEKGTMECATQLIAAKKMNESEGNPIDTIYGCSTTGMVWRFLKYNDNQITMGEKRYQIASELPNILGALQHIIEVSKKQFPELVS